MTSTLGALLKRLTGTQPKVELVIHHQCPSIELVSPMYCSEGATCYLSPDQRIDTGSTAQIVFNIDPSCVESLGALMYKLQRKSISQSNEEETTCTQFIILWMVRGSGEFYVHSLPIEHDKASVWDEDNFMKLVEQCGIFKLEYSPVEDTHLIHNGIVLMTRMNMTCEGGYYKLETTISETSMKEDTKRMRYFDMSM
jgi:hypothetical protein